MNARDPGASMLSTLLNPRPPAPPPASVVRRHFLDDSTVRAKSTRTADASRPPHPAGSATHYPPPDPGKVASAPSTRAPELAPAGQVSEFSAADKSLIRRLHGYMAPLQLLGVLNERLAADKKGAAPPFTIDQLRAEIAAVASPVPGEASDWGSLRKLLARARSTGVLDRVDEQVIEDFAVVFALNDRQAMALKEILLSQGDTE